MPDAENVPIADTPPLRAKKKLPKADKPRLTGAEIDAYATELLPFALKQMVIRFGQDAEEYAGECLYEALRTFDPTMNVPIRSWVIRYLHWGRRTAVAAVNGRAGTQKRAMYAKMTGIGDEGDGSTPNPAKLLTSGDDPSARIEARSEMFKVLRLIDRMDGGIRLVGLGKAMSVSPLRDIARMIGIGPGTARLHLEAVRGEINGAAQNGVHADGKVANLGYGE